ncbi:MAG: ATP-binding protein [Acidobacteria bacterium]|nr:ATP-binding protein [Acidobacteriota bacterium]
MQILSHLTDDEFFDREKVAAQLYSLASRCKSAQVHSLVSPHPEADSGRRERQNGRALNALLLGAPRTGKTELLRKTFDRLFADSDDLAPIYFTFRSYGVNVERFARDYFSQFFAQFLAFRLNDRTLLALAGEALSSLTQNTSSEDYFWVRNLVDSFIKAEQENDPLTMLRLALNAPIIAASQTRVVPFIMLDNFHLLAAGAGQPGDDAARQLLFTEFIRAFTLQDSIAIKTGADCVISPGYVLCGLRRVLVEMMPADEGVFERLELIRLEPLAEEPLEQMIRATANNLGVEISDSTAELMIQQLNRDIFYTRSMLDAAAAAGVRLKSFMEFERLYTEEILRGRVSHYLDAVMREVAADSRLRRAAIEALVLVMDSHSAVPIDAVMERISAFTADAEKLLLRMHARELVEINFGFVQAAADTVLADYVQARYRNEIAGARRPLAGEELLGEKLKHSYKLMMSRYNRSVEMQLIELLSRYDFQAVPTVLLDDAEYEKLYRRMSRVQARQSLEEDTARVRLPQMVLVDDLGRGDLANASWRMFAAKGFEGGIYSEANETLWLIALINSREPLDEDAVQHIDARLEAASRNLRIGNQTKTVRWYISKEGFAPLAKKPLQELKAHRSTYTQLDLLHDFLLKSAAKAGQSRSVNEVELIIPIEDEAELIAVRTVEQIARAADFDKESINQIKTALIEACINAAEHSDSPDRKIYHRFAIENDRLVISVSNKGKTFGWMNSANGNVESSETAKGTRGRGLKIIRGLMDEVHFERTDDGATLVMTKLLKSSDSQ